MPEPRRRATERERGLRMLRAYGYTRVPHPDTTSLFQSARGTRWAYLMTGRLDRIRRFAAHASDSVLTSAETAGVPLDLFLVIGHVHEPTAYYTVPVTALPGLRSLSVTSAGRLPLKLIFRPTGVTATNLAGVVVTPYAGVRLLAESPEARLSHPDLQARLCEAILASGRLAHIPASDYPAVGARTGRPPSLRRTPPPLIAAIPGAAQIDVIASDSRSVSACIEVHLRGSLDAAVSHLAAVARSIADGETLRPRLIIATDKVERVRVQVASRCHGLGARGIEVMCATRLTSDLRRGKV